MKYFIIYFLLCFSILESYGQSVSVLKSRFTNYLNFNGSLNSLVSFSDNSVTITNNGKPEFTIYENELPFFEKLFTSQKTEQCVAIYNWKKNTHLSKKQLDSLSQIKSDVVIPILGLRDGLKNRKIAIDPGHFGGNMEVGRVEQKYLYFVPNEANKLKDTIQFNEGYLTYLTAEVLKQKLEEQGAKVFITRPKQNLTAFQITYDDWISKKKKHTLDSLLKIGTITQQRHSALMKMTKQKLFWEFFRDYELMERARIINEFKPDITVIIHYNVDEKNTDWKNPSDKNFTMTFIGGGMTADNFSKTVNKIHFLRLLITNQLNESEKLSSLTVNQFNTEMKIAIAKKNDADYLRDNCLKTVSNGVFCRNLALCRTINSTLVYGECLYQDNLKECVALNKSDFEIYNLKMPKRIYEAANCYYNAINEYFKNK